MKQMQIAAAVLVIITIGLVVVFSQQTEHRSGIRTTPALTPLRISTAQISVEGLSRASRCHLPRYSPEPYERLPKMRSHEQRMLFVQQLKSNSIHGWTGVEQHHIVAVLSNAQRQFGVRGSVGEIGVHHGLFFLGLANAAAESDKLFALDIFNAQEKNDDGSGGSIDMMAKFLSNVNASGIDRARVNLIKGSSLDFSEKYFGDHKAGLVPVRLLSIDGGHSYETTVNDLILASCLMSLGGIVVVDDFPNVQWMGVIDAVLYFIRAQQDLVPFLIHSNKIYFTTPSHHERYLELVEEHFPGDPGQMQVPSRRTLGDPLHLVHVFNGQGNEFWSKWEDLMRKEETQHL